MLVICHAEGSILPHFEDVRRIFLILDLIRQGQDPSGVGGAYLDRGASWLGLKEHKSLRGVFFYDGVDCALLVELRCFFIEQIIAALK